MTSFEGYSSMLLEGQQERSEVNLAALVENYSTLLFRVAYSVLRNPAEAEDAVQDAFVRVMEHRRELPLVRDMRVWLVRIVWNLALDRRRRMRPDQMDDIQAGKLAGRTIPADVAMNQSEQVQQVLSAMERLPAAERHVLLLTALEDLSTKETAAVLGRSESAIRALLSRARARLRDRLEKEKTR